MKKQKEPSTFFPKEKIPSSQSLQRDSQAAHWCQHHFMQICTYAQAERFHSCQSANPYYNLLSVHLPDPETLEEDKIDIGLIGRHRNYPDTNFRLCCRSRIPLSLHTNTWRISTSFSIRTPSAHCYFHASWRTEYNQTVRQYHASWAPDAAWSHSGSQLHGSFNPVCTGRLGNRCVIKEFVQKWSW